MYDELVKQLRNRRICVQQLGTLNDYPLLGEAADAIEMLQKVYRSAESDHDDMRSAYIAEHDARIEEIARHRWIPVTERLPENGSHCLVARYDYVTKTAFVDLLWFDNSWWDRLNSGDYAVTHWMPPPEPPKEE